MELAQWIKRNWLLLGLIALGILGLGLALGNFLEPCTIERIVASEAREIENITVVDLTFVQPAPLVLNVAMDDSGSVKNFFEQERDALSLFVTTIDEQLQAVLDRDDALTGATKDFRVAFSQWNNKIPVQAFNLTDDIPSAIQQIDDNVRHRGGGTSLATALMTCVRTMFPEDEDPTATPISGDKERLCLVVSDGVSCDTDNKFQLGGEYTGKGLCTQASSNTVPEAGDQVFRMCEAFRPKIAPCTTDNIAKSIKQRGVKIAGIYVLRDGNDAGVEHLLKTSSCAAGASAATCEYFASTNPLEVKNSSQALAAQLVDNIATQNISKTVVIQNETIVIQPELKTVCAGESLWFFFLILFIPMLLYLFWRPLSLFFTKYCCPPKPPATNQEPLLEEQLFDRDEYTVPQETRISITSAPDIPAPESMSKDPVVVPPLVQDVQVEAPEPNTLIKQKRYRWSIKAADAYLWNLGGAGVAPLQVDFNGVAPPSAPKLEATKKNKEKVLKRISLRWSYRPPPDEEKSLDPVAEGDQGEEDSDQDEEIPDRRSRMTIASTRLLEAVKPTTWEPPPQDIIYEKDEIQPGDIDYEYTICLMKVCPCLRPTVYEPNVGKVDTGKERVSTHSTLSQKVSEESHDELSSLQGSNMSLSGAKRPSIGSSVASSQPSGASSPGHLSVASSHRRPSTTSRKSSVSKASRASTHATVRSASQTSEVTHATTSRRSSAMSSRVTGTASARTSHRPSVASTSHSSRSSRRPSRSTHSSTSVSSGSTRSVSTRRSTNPYRSVSSGALSTASKHAKSLLSTVSTTRSDDTVDTVASAAKSIRSSSTARGSGASFATFSTNKSKRSQASFDNPRFAG